MDPLISQVFADSHAKFEQLVQTLRGAVASKPQPDSFAAACSDELVKFKLWAGNLGAGHSGETYELSLDYRLREASFFKEQVSWFLVARKHSAPSSAATVSITHGPSRC